MISTGNKARISLSKLLRKKGKKERKPLRNKSNHSSTSLKKSTFPPINKTNNPNNKKLKTNNKKKSLNSKDNTKSPMNSIKI